MGIMKTDAIGAIASIVGFDGTDFYVLACNAAGELSVNGITVALPSGAATEATLAEIMARIGDETSPLTGSTNDLLISLAYILGATSIPGAGSVNYQLADARDIIGPLASPNAASVNGQLAQVQARLGALTTPAAGSVNKQLADMLLEIGATTSPPAGSSNNWLANIDGIIGALSNPAAGSVNKQLANVLLALTIKNQGLYSATYEYTGNVAASSGTITVDSTAVGASLNVVVEGLTAWLSAGSATLTQIAVVRSAAVYVLRRESATVLNQGYSIISPITLTTGDFIRAVFTAVGASSTGNLTVTGRKYATA